MTLASSPLNPSNAIESATFVVGFAKGLSKPLLDHIKSNLQRLAGELPGESQGTGGLQLGGLVNHGYLSIETQEVTRFVAKPNGAHEWAVQAAGNLVQVQCFNYTNFAEVWERARRYLLLALPPVDSEMLIAEVGFQVIDKFTYPVGSDWRDYEMSELFSPTSELLTKKAWNSGALWHVFQGWFEPHENARLLHQLNISNTILSNNKQLCAIVDHRGALRPSDDGLLFELKPLLEPAANGRMQLDEVFSALHQRNRNIVEDLLTAEKLQQIGIKKGN